MQGGKYDQSSYRNVVMNPLTVYNLICVNNIFKDPLGRAEKLVTTVFIQSMVPAPKALLSPRS
jgi:hypothetical protein